MGMTPDQYWKGNPWLAKAYREAFELKREIERQDRFTEGTYTYIAVSTALANAFREKGKPAYKFPTKPIDEPVKEKTPEEIRQEVYERLKRLKEDWDAGQQQSEDKYNNISNGQSDNTIEEGGGVT